jgi:hypothetical protein
MRNDVNCSRTHKDPDPLPKKIKGIDCRACREYIESAGADGAEIDSEVEEINPDRISLNVANHFDDGLVATGDVMNIA